MRSARVQGFRVSVAEILGQPGRYRDLSVEGQLEGIENPLGKLSAAPLVAQLRAESVVEGILVTGGAEAAAELACARCLEPLTDRLRVDVCELFVAPGHEAPPEEEAYNVEGLEIDIEPMLRDALTLALPLTPACKDDCKGLCARCGQNLNHGDCDCSDDEVDPRWAALADLRDELG